jgi:chemotaxis protein MotB
MSSKRRNRRRQPVWLITFADMMALLLCFFVLLFILSEPKNDGEYTRVAAAIKNAFGYATAGNLPVDETPLRSLIAQLEQLALNNFQEDNATTDPGAGVQGLHLRVTAIQDGVVFTIGGPGTFDEMSAQIKPAVERELEKLAVMLAGRNTKIQIIGHASAKYLPPDAPWSDLDELSFHRARNVKQKLVELGLDERVFRLQAAGTREPVHPRAVDAGQSAENRRVQIILTERPIEESNSDVYGTDQNVARGG